MDSIFELRTTFTSLAQFSDASYAVSIDRVVFVVFACALSVCVFPPHFLMPHSQRAEIGANFR